MRMPLNHRGASAVYTHCESAGWECKAKGKSPILICFAPKAYLRNFLWCGRMEMGSMRLLDRSWQPVLGSDLKHDLLEESILNNRHMTERFSWLRSKIGHNTPSFPGTMKYGCRTQTLCLKKGPPRWPPSSRECSLGLGIIFFFWCRCQIDTYKNKSTNKKLDWPLALNTWARVSKDMAIYSYIYIYIYIYTWLRLNQDSIIVQLGHLSHFYKHA